MKQIKYNVLFIFLFTILWGCESKTDWKKGIVEEQFLYDTASFPSCHAGTLAETPEGLVAAFFGGTHERHPDVCIYVCRMVDGKWTDPVEAANGIQNDTLRLPTWNPVLFQVPNGELLLFYKVGPSPSSWWGMLKRSTDHGRSWGEAEKLPDGFLGPIKNKPELLVDGTLICPTSLEGDGGWRVYFETTKDWGKTWEKSDFINDGKMYNIIQPSILKHKDGRLQILCRSKNAVVASAFSSDNGKTWGLVNPSGLPNNNSGTDAVTLKDGRHLVVYNHVKTPMNAPKGHRTPLNVAISDDGKNWFASLILEDSEISQYSYPAVIQSSDGMVHIIYTWRREKMKYVKVDPKKLNKVKIQYEEWPVDQPQ